MKHLNIILLIILISSCSESMLIKYSVSSDQGDFDILYSENIKEKGSYNWDSNVVSDGNVFIYVEPKEQNQVLDVRVYYIANNGLELYKRIVSENPILIKGKIRALP